MGHAPLEHGWARSLQSNVVVDAVEIKPEIDRIDIQELSVAFNTVISHLCSVHPVVMDSHLVLMGERCAWQALVNIAEVQPRQRVLIHAGGGGVGHVAVQIAKALGAHVIATVSADKGNFVRSLGADELIDYKQVDFSNTVRDIDVVFELVGKGNAERSLPVLRPGGLLVTAVERTNTELAAKTKAAGRRFAGIAVEPDYPALERLTELVEAGKLRPYVARTLPLHDVAKAHELVAQGSTIGKIALTI